MKSIIINLFILLWPIQASAETIFLMEDTHDLHPPYSQGWHATIGDSFSGEADVTFEVFVRGVGKRGDFFGILYLDCKQPQYSAWIVTGGSLDDPNSVPSAAIDKLRLEAC